MVMGSTIVSILFKTNDITCLQVTTTSINTEQIQNKSNKSLEESGFYINKLLEKLQYRYTAL